MDFVEYKRKRKTDTYYNIGDRIVTDTKDIVITDVKFVKDGKTKTIYKYKCNICGFDCNDFYYGGKYVSEVWVVGSQLRRSKECSCCSSKYVKSNINSVYKTNPECVPYFVNKKDAEIYNAFSNKKVDFNCPYCKTSKRMRVSDLNRCGFSCPCCSDGLSIGERIMYVILKNHDIDFIKEYSFKDSKYRYDFYLPKHNIIIEINGKQHYTETKINGQICYDEIVQNDINKKAFAIKRGVQRYICVDCQKSNVDYIITSIYKTKVLDILNIKNIDIDLIKKNIHTHTITKEICDLYNSNDCISIKDICEQLHFDRTTVRSHLKNGAELGWCDYNVDTYRYSERAKKINFNTDSFNSTTPIKYNGIYFKGACLCSKLSEQIFGKHISDSSIRRKLKKFSNQNQNFDFRYITKEEFNDAFAKGFECYGNPYAI